MLNIVYSEHNNYNETYNPMKKLLIALWCVFPAMLSAQDNTGPGIDPKIQAIISQMTLEEKASLCSGKDFWTTKPIERLHIPSIWMTDGPHGLRKSEGSAGFANKVVPATAWPSASSLAASWDPSLVEQEGEAIGAECQTNHVQIILGPGVNMKRSPLCGRNFEYYSEDPILAGEMGTAWIKGVQSQGVGTSLKHFAANNQETQRMQVSAEVSERALREIYLRAFEMAVKDAQPWTVMASYNRINGVYSCENPWLLTDVLRKDWGFKGFVVSDWGAVNDRVEGIRAGMDLQMMGGNPAFDKVIVDAVKAGKLPESDLDKVVADLLKIIFRADSLEKPNATYDKDQHHALARKIGADCIVLLKNQDKLLPIDTRKVKKIAVIGGFAKTARFLGGGSSMLSPTKVDVPLDEITKLAGKGVQVTYAEGYPTSDTLNPKMVAEAVSLAKTADLVILFAGLPDKYESEGYDRKHLDLPPNHNQLIEAVAAAQKNLVVVLDNGSPVLMPWISKVKTIVEGGLDGQASGGAIADVLFGVVNPSGKLAETYPARLEDNPSYLNFPGEFKKVCYGEGIFIGYRWYDARKIQPLFPFGYGLSYTTFAYSAMNISARQMKDTENLKVTCKVKNTGNVAGKEIVQLYVHDLKARVPRPEKELKAFAKVSLRPGEEKKVTFNLGKRDFAYYSEPAKDWLVTNGDYEILIGASSRDIKLKELVNMTSTYTYTLTGNSTFREWLEHPKGKVLLKPILDNMMKMMSGGKDSPVASADDMIEMLGDMPVNKLVDFSGGMISQKFLDDLAHKANQQ